MSSVIEEAAELQRACYGIVDKREWIACSEGFREDWCRVAEKAREFNKPTHKPEDVEAVQQLLRDTWAKTADGSWTKPLALAIIEAYGVLPVLDHDHDWDHLVNAYEELQAELAAANVALASDLPVSTIRLGTGLTATQMGWSAAEKIQQLDAMKSAAKALWTMDWSSTQEGWDFWYALHRRLCDTANALEASVIPVPQTPTEIGVAKAKEAAQQNGVVWTVETEALVLSGIEAAMAPEQAE